MGFDQGVYDALIVLKKLLSTAGMPPNLYLQGVYIFL